MAYLCSQLTNNTKENMNDKQAGLNDIVDIVVECTNADINGVPTITKEDILGASKKENHVMARAILCVQFIHEGYTVTTVALLLNRSEQAVRQLIRKGYDYIKTSRAARRAAAEIVLKCDKVFCEEVG